MNKNEWKKERRKFRLITISLFPDEVIKDKEDKKMVRDFIFDIVYPHIPGWFWNTRKRDVRHIWQLNESKHSCILNMEHAPNSYPHPTKNP